MTTEEQGRNPMVGTVNEPATRAMCVCCERPQQLAISDAAPFAFCPGARKIYELQAAGNYAITNYVLEGPKIVNPENGLTVFPKDEIPTQDELLARAKEDSGGSKPVNEGPGLINLGDAKYWALP